MLQQVFPGVFPGSYQQGTLFWQQGLDRFPAEVIRKEFHCHYADDVTHSLVCQTAFIGPANCANLVVLIGGTHGVEGFTGTAVQCDLFRLLAAGSLVIPPDTALLCINALNPWGYAHCRRCDGEGIDVNRNFADFTKPLPENPGYEKLRPLFRLKDRPAQARALAAQARDMGQREYEIAFSGGQYTDPLGPFFGGTGPGFSRGVIESLMAEYQLPGRRLAVIDVHTGLGPYGYGEVICDHDPGSGGAATARRWYGDGCTLPAEGTSSSVPKLGLLDYAWHRIMGPDSCFVTLEFGTLGTQSLFDVLLEEASCWASPDEMTEQVRQQMAKKMLAHFYPADRYWREAVIFRGRQVIQQAFSGVSG